MTNVSNLSVLVSNRNKAQKELEDALEAIRAELPEGVTLEVDEDVLGSSQESGWIKLDSKESLSAGDTIKFIMPDGESTVAIRHLASMMREGEEYQVKRIDSCGDARIIGPGLSCERDTCGVISGVWVKTTNRSANQSWTDIRHRSEVNIGDVVRVNPARDISDTRLERLPQGRTFTVTRIDSCYDYHLDHENFDMCNRYSYFQKLNK